MENLNLIQLQWKRNVKGTLELWVKESTNWVIYKQAKYYVPDMDFSSQSGFATFQQYLKLSKKNIFKLEILKVNLEDMNNED